MKKVMLVIVLVIIVAIMMFGLYTMTEQKSIPKTEMTAYADSPMQVADLIKEIETHSYFKGYNNTTVGWLKSLDSENVVLSNNDSYIIMSPQDAEKLHIESVTDVSITDTFNCHEIEKRPLGKDLKNIIFVEDVNFKKQDIEYFNV